MDSKTPRSDEVELDVYDSWQVCLGSHVPASFARQLETELIAAQAELTIAKDLLAQRTKKCAEESIHRGDLQIALKDAQAEIAALRADAERIDWLIKNEAQIFEVNNRYSVFEDLEVENCKQGPYFDDARAAIDSARKEKP